MKRIFCLLLLGALLPFGSCLTAAEQDAEKQTFEMRIVARPLVGIFDFGRTNFKQDLKSKLDLSLPGFTTGGEFQFGIASSKKWGVGVNIGLYRTGMDDAFKKHSFEYLTISEGVYGEYVFIRKGIFELNGQLGLGVGQSVFNFENSLNAPSNITLDNYMSLGVVNLRQKLLGYASAGISAKCYVSKHLAFGVHVKWLQQIGNGYWYASRSNVRISDLSKSSLVPLQLGLDVTF